MTTRASLAASPAAALLLLSACSISSNTPATPTGPAPVVVVTRVAGVAAVATRPPPAATPTPAPVERSSGPTPSSAPPPAPAAPTQPEAPAPPPRPVERLEAVAAARLGTYAGELSLDRVGLVVENLATGERFAHNELQLFHSGSVYKLTVAWEVMRRADQGQLRLTDELTIERVDALEPEPAGGVALGERVTVRQALEAMMGVSSNAAAYALLRLVGRSELNASLRALGLESTSVPLLNGPAVLGGQALDPEHAITTPGDMARLLRLLATDRTLTADGRGELRRLLAVAEPIDPLRDGSPAGTEVLAKVGTLDDATNAAGLLRTPRGPVIVAVFTTEVPPGRARDLIADLARAVYQVYGAA